MNKKEVMNFLKAHQPFSEQDEDNLDALDQLEEARKFCVSNLIPESIPYWLGIFGPGDGSGIFQLIEDVLIQFSPEQVIPHLKVALTSGDDSISYWCTQIAERFPSEELIEPLAEVLHNSSLDIRYAVLTALSPMKSERAKKALHDWVDHETDSELRAEIQATLKRL